MTIYGITFISGILVFAFGLWLMVWACDHPQFGRAHIGGLPHWSNLVAGAAWVPIVIGAATALLTYVYTAGLFWP